MTYDNVGLQHNISWERVYQITKRILKQIDPKIVERYNIRAFRLDSDRLITLIEEFDKNG